VRHNRNPKPVIAVADVLASRQTSVTGSPSRTRARKRRRSSMTELSFHCIHTLRKKAESVTHVSGTNCHLCLGQTRTRPDLTSSLGIDHEIKLVQSPTHRASIVERHENQMWTCGDGGHRRLWLDLRRCRPLYLHRNVSWQLSKQTPANPGPNDLGRERRVAVAKKRGTMGAPVRIKSHARQQHTYPD
jgi:hypothetical protein